MASVRPSFPSDGGSRAIPRQSVDVLGVKVSAVNMDMALGAIEGWIESGDHQYVCVTGVHGVMESQSDESLRAIHNNAGLVTPDGMPLVWLSRLRGAKHVRRVYGPDLMHACCELSVRHGWRHFLFGGAPGVPDLLSDRLQRRFPGLKIVGTHSPAFRALTDREDEEVVRLINEARPDIVWVGLSTPKQERWMAAHLNRLRASVLLGVGAAFDFHAGLKRQAPRWMQQIGMEWFFRLATEPRRLWRRYLTNNPRFVWTLIRRSFGTGAAGSSPPVPPTTLAPVNANSRFILGMRADSTSYSDAAARVLAWANIPESRYVCVSNVHVTMESYDSAEFRGIVNGADLVTPDGMPLVWALRLFGVAEATRVYGPTLTEHLLERAAMAGVAVGFYGATAEVVTRMLEVCRRRFPELRVAYAYAPPFRQLTTEEDVAAVREVNESGARILFVGLGCPKQERWMAQHKGRVNAVMLGVGFAFDILAGVRRSAPAWMQRAGLEWLFRLALEPRRLWRRYVYNNPRFLVLLAGQYLKSVIP